MLLLLFLGVTNTPIVDGVRAYATVSYSNVMDAEGALSLVNPTSDSVALTTNAYPTEE